MNNRPWVKSTNPFKPVYGNRTETRLALSDGSYFNGTRIFYNLVCTNCTAQRYEVAQHFTYNQSLQTDRLFKLGDS